MVLEQSHFQSAVSRSSLPHAPKHNNSPDVLIELTAESQNQKAAPDRQTAIAMSAPHDSTSTALPESKQDANLAGTYAARPGTNSIPAGVSTTEHSSTAPFVDSTPAQTTDKSLSDSVKNSLDSVTQPATTQSVTDQLPSAQQATDALKAGASSLVAGISSLALGVSDAATKNASDSHPESERAHDVDDLHIPGAFDSATSDREDIADVQRGLQSASDSLPSTQAVKEAIPGINSQSSKLFLRA